jgi:hypothetical protein
MNFVEVIAEQDGNEVVARFTDALRDEMNPETLAVGVYIILFEQDIIVDDEVAFEKAVLNKAMIQGHFGGLTYYPEDFEEGTNPDDGLSWVGFGDILQTLKQVAQSFK